MRRCFATMLTLAAAAMTMVLPTGTASAAPAALSAARLTVSWGKALEVPGTAALNVTGQAQVQSISCPAAGDCAAGGLYNDASGHNQAFVAAESHSKWATARELPGTGALDLGGQAYVEVISCAAASYCSATGSYIDGSARVQTFVAGESRGHWGHAVTAPGLAALNSGGQANPSALSCAARGDCTGGGSYKDVAGHFEAFVISETSGRWSKAVEVRGTAVLNTGGAAAITAVSCTSAGNCAAGGYYTDPLARTEPFVVTETRGHWGAAREVPGSGAVNTGGKARLDSLSCSSPGNCSAGGFFTTASHHQEAMIMQEKKGVWGRATEVPGSAKLNTGNRAAVESVSCARGAGCAAVGYVQDTIGQQAFVVSQHNGRWGTAVKVPGLSKLNRRDFADATSVSCASAGNCSTGGFYFDASNHQQAFVATELSGVWHNALEIPGSAALNKGNDEYVYSIACASAGNCSAGGFYKDSAGHIQAFLVSETARRR